MTEGWRSLDANLNGRQQVLWTFQLLYLVQILINHVACDATTPCLQLDPVNVRVSTVFSESVVRARLSAVHNDSRNDTGLTVAQFRVSRVLKGPLPVQNFMVFTTDDLSCLRINSSCLVFVNISRTPSDGGVREDVIVSSERVSRISQWSRRALRYIRMHICWTSSCSKYRPS